MTRRRWLGLASLLLLLSAALLSAWGFGRLAEMRLLERVPPTAIANVVAGPVILSGRVEVADEVLNSPTFAARSVYYDWVNRIRDDSRRQRERFHQTASVPFYLVDDESGARVLVDPAGAIFDLPYTVLINGPGYWLSETRIDIDQQIFVFGVAVSSDDGLVVRFDRPGLFDPVITTTSVQAQRGDAALFGIGLTWLALVALSGGILLLCFAALVHRTAVVLLLLTLGNAGMLGWWGWSTARLDLAQAAAVQEDRERLTRDDLVATLAADGIAWDGDWAALETHLTGDALAPETVARLRAVRLDLADAALRAQAAWTRWPERWVAAVQGIAPPPAIPLPASDRSALAALADGRAPTHLAGWAAAVGALGGGALALLLPWVGFRRLRLQRLIETVPTSPTGAAAYGLTELQGVADLPPGAEPLTSPVTGKPCVMYRYRVRPIDGTGRRHGHGFLWSRDIGIPFVCRDRDGTFPIDPAEADLFAETRQWDIGTQRHMESCLFVGAPLYALGGVGIDARTGSSLIMQSGGAAFVLSGYSEPELVLRKGRIGFTLLTGGMLGVIGMALSLAGGLGSFDGLTYMAAALAAPAFLLLLLALLAFNDLVALRERLRRTWANIDVSLKKRADLLPALEDLVRDLLAHERAVLEDLASVRDQACQRRQLACPEAEAMMAAERRALDRLLILRESRPDLAAAGPVGRLLDTLVALENEIALMRDGFNRAVERYNSRRDRFPDRILALCFGFHRERRFQAPVEVRTLAEGGGASSQPLDVGLRR